MLIYVDDIFFSGTLSTLVQTLITQLSQKFALKDLGPLHYFLGIEATCLKDNILHLSKIKYIKDLLHRTNMLSSNSQSIPMVSSLCLTVDNYVLVEDLTLYFSIAGALQYATITRPELSFSVNKISNICINHNLVTGMLLNRFFNI